MMRKLTLLLALSLLSYEASAAIAIANLVGDGSPAVESIAGTNAVNVTGVNITTGSALLVCYEAQASSDPAVPTVSGGGGTGTSIVSITGDGPNRRTGCIKYTGATGSGVTITVTFSASFDAASVSIDEVTGANNGASWTNTGTGSGSGTGSGRPVLSISGSLSAHASGSATYLFGNIDDTAGASDATAESGDWTVLTNSTRGSFSTRFGSARNLVGDVSPTLTMGQNASTAAWFFLAFEIPEAAASNTVVNPLSGKGGAAAHPTT